MPARERVLGAPLCDLVGRWLIAPKVLVKLRAAAINFENQTGRQVFLISGWRSQRAQEALEASGRPTAPEDLSTHRTCPATGADIDLGFLVSNLMKAVWGSSVVFAGLRGGGGSPIDPETGIPTDWAHVDDGPRSG